MICPIRPPGRGACESSFRVLALHAWLTRCCGTPRERTSVDGGGRTRTPRSPTRACSRSPTGWAATRTATSPAGPPSRPSPGCRSCRPGRRPRHRRRRGVRAARRPRPAGPGAGADGHDPDRDGLGRPPLRRRAHRRLPRLPAARPGPLPAHPRPHDGPDARGRREAHPEEAANHPRGSVLVRALQSGGSGEPDVFWQDALPGDRYLLCSDGVSGLVPADAIRAAMAEEARPADVIARLIGLANQAYGHDNSTCVVADVVPAGRSATSARCWSAPRPRDMPGRAVHERRPGVDRYDIARLVGVGRATVSNWRRRDGDFPARSAGPPPARCSPSPTSRTGCAATASRSRCRSATRSGVWQRLRASGDDFRLADLVGWAGLTSSNSAATRAAARARRGTGRSRPARPAHRPRRRARPRRRLRPAPPALRPGPLAAPRPDARRHRGADDPPRLPGRRHRPRPGVRARHAPAGGARYAARARPGHRPGRRPDRRGQAAARRDARRGRRGRLPPPRRLPGEAADAVVCDPPSGDRAWGREDLAGDPRWEYGLPPRGEPELAWVQHCLAHVRPGGRAAVLMPTAAAGRRPGRRVRANLLRVGALRAVLTLAPGGPDLWLLRRPRPDEPLPAAVLLLDAEGDLDRAERAWERRADGEFSVPVIDLLDDEVDVSPARHRPRQSGAAFADRFTGVLGLAAAAPAPPGLDLLPDQRPLPFTTLSELAKACCRRDQPRARPAAVRRRRRPGPHRGRRPRRDGPVRHGRRRPRPGHAGTRRRRRHRRRLRPGHHVRRRARPLPHPLPAGPGPPRPRFLAGFLAFARTRTGTGSSRTDLRRARIPASPWTTSAPTAGHSRRWPS